MRVVGLEKRTQLPDHKLCYISGFDVVLAAEGILELVSKSKLCQFSDYSNGTFMGCGFALIGEPIFYRLKRRF